MPPRAIELSQRTAATTAGVAYLISFVAVLAANFGAIMPLFVRDNLAGTAQNILEHQLLFRLGIVGDLVYCLGAVIVAASFYSLLKPVHPGLATIVAFFRLVNAFLWLLVVVQLFSALRILTNASYLSGLGEGGLHAVMKLLLSGSDQYYVGLLFWSLSATIGGYLLLVSRYIPRPLAIAAIASSVWCVACTIAYYLYPGFSDLVNLWWFDSPMVLCEIAISVRLITRGVAPSPEA